MGVICQIHLQRPPDGTYQPGSAVTGSMKYVLDKDTVYSDIVVSFKGNGKCSWTEGSSNNRRTYCGKEKLVNCKISILNKHEEAQLAAGEYDYPFEFYLPYRTPPSYKDDVCEIKYFVSIKFIKPTTFSFAKKFKSTIPVTSGVDPTLPDGEIIYGVEKKFGGLFSNKGKVNLKATLSRSFSSPLETIEVMYDIENNSNVKITRATTNLLEVITYTANCGHTKTSSKKYKECKTSIEEIDSKGMNHCGVIVPTLLNTTTIQHSKILKREYMIAVAIKFPMPHRNAVLKIPLEIGTRIYEHTQMLPDYEDIPRNDDPPSYWEIMEEEKGFKVK